MTSPWAGLLWEASLATTSVDGAADRHQLERAATEYGELRFDDRAELAELAGPLLVPDTALAALDRTVAGLGIGPLEVCVVNTSGAGGLLGLAERECDDLMITSVHSALRDLDDLAGNAARVAAASRVLPESITVHVGLPAAPGWEAAAELVEAEGLQGAVGADPAQLATLVELDLPFIVTDGPAAARIVHAVHVLVADGDVALATAALQGMIESPAPALTEDDAVRVRRRLRGLWTTDIVGNARSIGELTAP